MIAALGLSLGISSCGDDPSSGTPLVGRISPIVEIDGSIISATCTPASRANEGFPVAVTDLKLKLTSDDGSFAQEWESVNDFDETQDFKVGDYTLEAYYGKEEDNEGYSKPHIYGSQDISVKYDCTTNVALKAEMKNSRVFVRYTDAFKSYMTSYSATILTQKGKYIDMPGDETSPAYVTPGEVTVNLTFTTANGKTAIIEAAKFDAVAKTEHVVTMDIEGGDAGADAVLKIIFDDTVAAEDVDIDLSDDLIDAPAPNISPEGWTSGQTFLTIENSRAPEQVKANILASGKISSVMLTTNSPSLRGEGWPEKIDLVKASEAESSKLTSLGLNTRGIWKNPDVMGVIDFTDVFPHLGVSPGLEESVHTFSLQVKDRLGSLSEVYEFSVKTGLGSVEINWATAEVGRKTINAEVTYNGSDELKDVKFTKQNTLGTWDDLTASNIQAVSGKPGTYTVTLTTPKAIERSLPLRAKFGSAVNQLQFEITTPEFVLIASPNDVFAHCAIVTVKCDDADDALVAQNLSFTLNGREWENSQVDGADIIFTSLREGADYEIEASSVNHSATAKITTETEDHLPGCSHGDTGEHSVGFATSSWSSQRMGGVDFYASGLVNGNTNKCVQYLWSVSGWATVNELTTSPHGKGIGSAAIIGGSSYKATSGTIPANGRSTQSFVDGGAIGMTTHADGHTVGKADLHKNKQHNGTNAALIRTVGWGSGNSAAAGTGDNKGFNTCQNMTPGELYLGEYNNGPQYGYNFTSRPSSLSFWYHYDVVTKGNGDYGTAEITIYDSEGEVVATGSVKLPEYSNYDEKDSSKPSYKQVQIPLTYPKGASKAAKISIIFRSTDKYLENNPALQKDTKFWHTPGGNNTSGGEYVGSELYIDDVRLTY